MRFCNVLHTRGILPRLYCRRNLSVVKNASARYFPPSGVENSVKKATSVTDRGGFSPYIRQTSRVRIVGSDGRWDGENQAKILLLAASRRSAANTHAITTTPI